MLQKLRHVPVSYTHLDVYKRQVVQTPKSDSSSTEDIKEKQQEVKPKSDHITPEGDATKENKDSNNVNEPLTQQGIVGEKSKKKKKRDKNLPVKEMVLSSETQNGAQVQAEFMTSDINVITCGDHLKDSDVIENRYGDDDESVDMLSLIHI